MSHNLFEDFLDNAESYRSCEKYWKQLVEEVA